MGKHYDENKVLKLLAKQGIKTGRDGYGDYIILNKAYSYGIHTWGKIDFLTHYSSYRITWINSGLPEDNNVRNEKKKRKADSERKHKKNFHKMNM